MSHSFEKDVEQTIVGLGRLAVGLGLREDTVVQETEKPSNNAQEKPLAQILDEYKLQDEHDRWFVAAEDNANANAVNNFQNGKDKSSLIR